MIVQDGEKCLKQRENLKIQNKLHSKLNSLNKCLCDKDTYKLKPC